jgi:hypothetical protein
MWVQRHHCGKDRNIKKPIAVEFCSWINAGTKRLTQATEHVSKMQVGHCVKSSEEAASKLK